MTWELVESDEDLLRAIEDIRAGGDVAVDTEFMRVDTYYPQIALLQLCSGDVAWLVDPLAVGDLSAVHDLLIDPGVVKVIHSCSEDLEVFRHWLGALPDPLIDTQRAAALLGEGFGLGYRALVETLVGVSLEKGETRSDWLKRPLTESQCHYAAQDVLQLLPAWQKLRERALAENRMPWLLEEGVDARNALAEREPHRRIKGAGRLRPRELAVLRHLSEWREERARRLDRPRGWVLSDKACLAIAREQPRRLDALAELDDLPPAVLRRQGERLLELVEAGLGTPATDLPEAGPAPLAPPQRAQLKALREVLRELAGSLGVAPEAALSGSELELLVREAAGETIKEPPRWSGWRSELVIPPLRRSLAGAADAP